MQRNEVGISGHNQEDIYCEISETADGKLKVKGNNFQNNVARGKQFSSERMAGNIPQGVGQAESNKYQKTLTQGRRPIGPVEGQRNSQTYAGLAQTPEEYMDPTELAKSALRGQEGAAGDDLYSELPDMAVGEKGTGKKTQVNPQQPEFQEEEYLDPSAMVTSTGNTDGGDIYGNDGPTGIGEAENVIQSPATSHLDVDQDQVYGN